MYKIAVSVICYDNEEEVLDLGNNRGLLVFRIFIVF